MPNCNINTFFCFQALKKNQTRKFDSFHYNTAVKGTLTKGFKSHFSKKKVPIDLRH